MKAHNLITFLIFSLFSTSSFADANDKGKDFAESLKDTVSGAASSPDYSSIPRYEGTDVPEKSFYKRGGKIEDDALINAVTDPTSQFISGARATRPDFTLNQDTDPLFKRQDEIQELAQSLTDTYSGCVDLPVGTKDVTVLDRESCLVNGRRDTVNFTCSKSVSVSCKNANAGQQRPYSISSFSISGDDSPYGQSGNTFWFGVLKTNHKGDCTRFTRTIQIYVEDKSLIQQFTFDRIQYNDWLDININGFLVYRGVGPNQGTGISGTFKCNFKKQWVGTPFNAISRLRTGWNTIVLTNLVGNNGNYYAAFTLKRIYGCTRDVSIADSCPVGETPARGTLIKSVCLSSGYRTIKGVLIYQPCWLWRNDYTRLTDPIYTREPMCDVVEEKGCYLVSADCVLSDPAFCITRERVYECPRITSARKTELCGSILTCPDGNCASEYQVSLDATDDFKDAATSMVVANEIASQFNFTDPSIFTGDKKRCKKKPIGISDCCADSGWALDTGLASCSSEEVELGIKKEEGAAVYIGSYKTGSWPFKITNKIYCTYPSKLGRIIVEEGFKQLGWDFGSTRDPNCSGFTMTEIESLDFNAMDLSEFYADVEDNALGAALIDPAELANELKDKLAK